MRRSVVMPATVTFRHAGIVEFSTEPFVRLGMSVGEGKNRNLPVLVSGVVIHLCGIHVDPELRTTNAVGMNFAKNENVRRPTHRGGFLEYLVTAAGFVVPRVAFPGHEDI